jgi:hypothetical protein
VSNEAPTHERIHRVLMALDAASASLERFQAAVELAVLLRAELTALLVEDEELLRVVDYPHAQHVSLVTGRSEPIDRETVVRQLRATAQQMERRLARLAEVRQVAIRLEVVSGSRLSSRLDESHGADLLVMDRPGSGLRPRTGLTRRLRDASKRAGRPVLLLRSERPLSPGPVAALLAPEAPIEPVLGWAAQFATRLHHDLVILMAAPEAARRLVLRREADAWLGRAGLTASFHRLVTLSPDSVAGVLGLLQAALLVCPKTLPDLGDLAATEIVGRLSLPVCLVG